MRLVSIALSLCLAAWLAPLAPAAEILLPQVRSAFQTNEAIDISVVRTADAGLAAGTLSLVLTDDHGSRLEFGFPVAAGGKAKTEHLHVNGWLLRPGMYEVEVACDGQKATTAIEVYSHVRQSSFRLINWGQAKTREQQLVQGEDGLGFNLFYGHYGQDTDAHFIRAGVDFMANCVMSGGHQMDLRMECDWSDPLVMRGGTRRVVRRAMMDRTRPNVPGVHFYDEPGLTWHKHPATGEFTPHGIPSQLRLYKAAYDREAPQYNTLDPKDPKQAAAWVHFARWKLGIMDAAWREAQHGVSRVRPDYLSVTQSQYGWTAFTDGYYFNVVRSLPVTSGHGGYHDYGLGIFNPLWFLEFSRARDQWKPCWYLPTWYGNTTADQFRCEQNLSFATGIQGMISPPDCEPATNPVPRQGIVESNQMMKRLGTIFTTMPPSKPPVAILYSLSQLLHTQTLDRSQNYSHSTKHGDKLPLVYLAGKLIQQPLAPVLDEDILDGTLAADHKAIVLTGIDYLDANVIAGLEEFAAAGGVVLMTSDCTVQIKGAKSISVTPRMPDQEKIDELTKAAKYQELGPYTLVHKQMEGATPTAKALKAELAKAGIKSVVECDQPTLTVTRHALGDVEYFFAVNVTPDKDLKNDKGQPVNNGLVSLRTPMIQLPPGGHVYNVLDQHEIVAPLAPGQKEPAALGPLGHHYGPGQMRIFAKTSRPIGGVAVSTPVVRRELVLEKDPLAIDFAATVFDGTQNRGTLSGSIPLEITVRDPLGATRYTLYRATKLGQCSLSVPLAANDAAGKWQVTVTELISGKSGKAEFDYTPPRVAPTIAGGTWRAVHLEEDRANVFRFARTFNEVTIVAGKGDYAAAIARLKDVLKPWGITCKEMPLDAAVKSRTISEEEAKTWVGLDYAGKDQIKAGDGNAPQYAGFAVQGPVILLGNPEDNAIIAFLQKYKFLPYDPAKDKLPGVGRGMFAWQRDGVGAGQESVALIAYDADGMSEAVGSFYEAIAGLDPLTRWTIPSGGKVTPASQGREPKELKSEGIASLPDRVLAIALAADEMKWLSHDGRMETVRRKATGVEVETDRVADPVKVAADIAPKSNPAALADAQKKQPRYLVKLVVDHGANTAIAYWGGRVELRAKDGTLLAATQLPQDVTALAADGKQLLAGLADGRILSLK